MVFRHTISLTRIGWLEHFHHPEQSEIGQHPTIPILTMILPAEQLEVMFEDTAMRAVHPEASSTRGWLSV